MQAGASGEGGGPGGSAGSRTAAGAMKGGGEPAAPWSPDEVARFFDAFHEHGADFDKVAAAVGGAHGADACEALHRKQAAYLSIPKALQSAQAFAAIVENMQKEEAEKAAAGGGGDSGGATEGAGSGGVAASALDAALKREGEGEEEEEEGSEGRGRHGRHGTPLRSGRRTPVSGAKRTRGGDIYEYYDEGAEAMTESARKRRAGRHRVDSPAGQRRRQDADEAKGIDALLALAVAGEESLGMGSDSEEEAAPARRKAKPRGTPQRRARLAYDEEDEEEPADAGAVDDEGDEDFAPPQRRTPYSTPARPSRLGRPGSAHATPRRSGSRGVGGAALAGASPGALGLRGLSPYGYLGVSPLEGGGDLMSDLGLADLSYITSPGFPQFAPGFVPSPQNPMPRMRRRKSAPERMPQSVGPAIRTLFTRRTSLASSLLPSFGYPAGGGALEEGGGAAAAAAAAAGGAQTPAEAQLRHCLQQPRTQRWAAAEFCYSALDRPFFMFSPLAGLLTALGLGEDARLTRREWALVRSGLGKPRRLSFKFLKEERARLERWREGCRQQYQAGPAVDPKVADHMPRPLSVGQRVVARHPSTRQLHDGAVLTVTHNSYRVQFDRQELGVEMVRDTDIMPANPAENLPPAQLRGRPCLLLNGRSIINGQPVRPLPPPVPAGAAAAALPAAVGATPLGSAAAAGLLPPGIKPEDAAAGGAAAAGQQQARAADAKALAELVVGLDKKEALLLQLRAMNDEAAAGMHAADASGAAAPAFVNAYAGVVLQLKDVNDKVKVNLEALEEAENSQDGSPGAVGHQQLGASLAADAALQRQMQAHTPETLAAATLEEACSIIAACQEKLAESAAATPEAGAGGSAAPAPEAVADAVAGAADAAAAQQPGQREPGADGSPAGTTAGSPAASTPAAALPNGSAEARQLNAIIQGCVHSLVLLQQGAAQGGALPPAALSAALDAALAAVAPRAAANRALYEEIQAAVKGLKQQIGAAS